jgi:ubiquinone/menaquinone biosynthesis C-methylase UbiE
MLPLSRVTFDSIAARYDELWTHSHIGRLQREAVWRDLDALFRPRDEILDLGCGTGEDALHFMGAGVRVRAIDASSEMVRIARGRGVDAAHLPIERVHELTETFDGVISNFGVLNCIENLEALRGPLARVVRHGGYLAICVMGRFCLWETAWYLWHRQPRKAFRRWIQNGSISSLGVPVFYPSIGRLRRAFAPDFAPMNWHGIGIAVPPSYVTLPAKTLEALGRLEGHLSPLRALSDHRLLIFVRQ